MWFQSFPVSALVLSAAFGHVSFAGPIAKVQRDVSSLEISNEAHHEALARAVTVNEDIIQLDKRLEAGTATRFDKVRGNAFSAFYIIQAYKECQTQKAVTRAQEKIKAEAKRKEDRTMFQRFKEGIWDGLTFWKQFPKVWSQENIDAFLRSARDLKRAFSELPSAVTTSLHSVVSAENIRAFTKSIGDLKKGVTEIPNAMKNGFEDLKDPSNIIAFEKSLENLGTGMLEIPGAVKNGAGDFVQGVEFFMQVAPGQLNAALNQLPTAVTILMQEYDKTFPAGSNQRKILDAVLASLPLKPDTFKAFPMKMMMNSNDLTKAINTACANDKESLSLIKQS
ncbi:hypothetical protein AA313_de0210107 [Arthrobotrys entomopaga]|nr:hypothetical protein AA313_de0210107 [Arthrobotrys entomopaga]